MKVEHKIDHDLDILEIDLWTDKPPFIRVPKLIFVSDTKMNKHVFVEVK